MNAGKEMHRTVLTATKLTPDERRAVEMAAQHEGLSVSAILRRALLRDLRRNPAKEGSDA